MGEAVIARKSSGGGSNSDAYAAINVIYPSGSTCTCSNGSKTLSVKETNSSKTFIIPESGNWTVTTTNGANSLSKTFSPSKGQGIIMHDLLIGNSVVSGFTSQDVNVTDYNNYIRVSYGGDAWIGTGYYCIKLDLTQYKTLYIEGCYDIYNQKSTNNAGVSVDKEIKSDYATSVVYFSSSTKAIYSLDVTNYGKDTYICIFGQANDTATEGWFSTRADVYNMWLET